MHSSPSWLGTNWPYIVFILTSVFGGLRHPKVRKWIASACLAVFAPAKLIIDTARAESKAQRFEDSASYNDTYSRELEHRLDQMDARLAQANEDFQQKIVAMQYTHKLEMMAMEDDLKEVRLQAIRRKDALKRMAIDREAAIIHIGILEAHLVQKGEVVPPRPDWQSSGYDVLIPDSLGP